LSFSDIETTQDALGQEKVPRQELSLFRLVRRMAEPKFKLRGIALRHLNLEKDRLTGAWFWFFRQLSSQSRSLKKLGGIHAENEPQGFICRSPFS